MDRLAPRAGIPILVTALFLSLARPTLGDAPRDPADFASMIRNDLSPQGACQTLITGQPSEPQINDAVCPIRPQIAPGVPAQTIHAPEWAALPSSGSRDGRQRRRKEMLDVLATPASYPPNEALRRLHLPAWPRHVVIRDLPTPSLLAISDFQHLEHEPVLVLPDCSKMPTLPETRACTLRWLDPSTWGSASPAATPETALCRVQGKKLETGCKDFTKSIDTAANIYKSFALLLPPANKCPSWTPIESRDRLVTVPGARLPSWTQDPEANDWLVRNTPECLKLKQKIDEDWDLIETEIHSRFFASYQGFQERLKAWLAQIKAKHSHLPDPNYRDLLYGELRRDGTDKWLASFGCKPEVVIGDDIQVKCSIPGPNPRIRTLIEIDTQVGVEVRYGIELDPGSPDRTVVYDELTLDTLGNLQIDSLPCRPNAPSCFHVTSISKPEGSEEIRQGGNATKSSYLESRFLLALPDCIQEAE